MKDLVRCITGLVTEMCPEDTEQYMKLNYIPFGKMQHYVGK